MIPVTCFVQEGQIDPATGEALRGDLSQLSQSALGSEAHINWVEVKNGNGFTEAKPSTSSLVSIQCDRALSKDERMAMMNNICDAWMEKTGCSLNEVIAAVYDPAQ